MNIDIIYMIGLYVNFRRSIALISTCKTLWERRKLFYLQKGNIWYPNAAEINLWTPEQNYYALDKLFIVGATAKDSYTNIHYERFHHIKLTNIYDYNNATQHLINCDTTIIFKITHRYLVIYGRLHHVSGEEWKTEYYDNIQDVHMAVDNMIQSQEYTKSIIVDLKYSKIAYTKFNQLGHNSIVKY